MNIPNENGEFVQINLPKSPDTFTVEALAETVVVESKTGVWKPKTQSSAFLALAEKFPEIKDIEEGKVLKQGNLLPVIISPSNVNLNDGMTYALYNVQGEVVATLSNPVKGLKSELVWENNKYTTIEDPNNPGTDITVTNPNYGSLISRSTGDDCFWTLEMTPVLDNNGEFVGSADEKYSLAIVKKSNGAVNKTAFDYKIVHNAGLENVKVTTEDELTVKTNQEGVATIDLMKDVFTVENGYGKYYFCELVTTDPATIEQYGIELNGNVLTVKFPAGIGTLSDVVSVKCTALGINGSTFVTPSTSLSFTREIAATEGSFSDQEFVLTTTKNNSNEYINKVRWNVEDLGFSALELKNFMSAGPTITLEVKGDNDTWSEVSDFATNGTRNVTFYKADGNSTTVYTEAVTYGVNMDNSYLTPGKEYRLTLQVTSDNNVVTYKQQAKLTVANPTINIAPKSDRSENGALVLWADAPELYSVLTHSVNPELAKDNFTGVDFVTFVAFTDVDHELWKENSNDPKVWGNADWLANSSYVLVNKYDAESDDAEDQAIGKARKMKVECTLFGNEENKYTYEFTVVAKSTIYSSNPASVISIDPSFATVKKGTSTKDPRPLFTAKYAEGINKDTEGKKGEKYNLFDYTLNDYYEVPDYAEPKLDNAGKYLVNSDGMPVEVEKADWLNLGLSMDQYMGASKAYFVADRDNEGNDCENLKADDNGIIYIRWSRVALDDNAQGTYQKDMKDIFNKYISRIAFVTTKLDANADKSKKIASTKFALTKAVAGVSIDETTGVIGVASSVAANTNVDVKLTIVDQWGMTMEYVYTVKVTN